MIKIFKSFLSSLFFISSLLLPQLACGVVSEFTPATTMQPLIALRYDAAVIPADASSLPVHRLVDVQAESSLRVDHLLKAPKSGSTVYRGVRTSHPGYKNATQGVANSRRSVFGHKNPALHNAGNTKSKFTSWTTDRNIAKRFSGSDGVILETTVPKSQMIFTPDKFREAERLLLGPVRGATVTRP